MESNLNVEFEVELEEGQSFKENYQTCQTTHQYRKTFQKFAAKVEFEEDFSDEEQDEIKIPSNSDIYDEPNINKLIEETLTTNFEAFQNQTIIEIVEEQKRKSSKIYIQQAILLKIGEKKRSFLLEGLILQKMNEYNPLLDTHLANFLSNHRKKQILLKNGLIDKNGVAISQKYKYLKKEHGLPKMQERQKEILTIHSFKDVPKKTPYEDISWAFKNKMLKSYFVKKREIEKIRKTFSKPCVKKPMFDESKNCDHEKTSEKYPEIINRSHRDLKSISKIIKSENKEKPLKIESTNQTPFKNSQSQNLPKVNFGLISHFPKPIVLKKQLFKENRNLVQKSESKKQFSEKIDKQMNGFCFKSASVKKETKKCPKGFHISSDKFVLDSNKLKSKCMNKS